jgi:hypothetical protein
VNSQKTIIEKLNLNKFPRKLVLQAPEDIDDFMGMEHDSSIMQSNYDLIFIFIFSIEEISKLLQIVIKKI